MFITTTADPLSAFLISRCGLSLKAFRPFVSSLIRFLCLHFLGLLFIISCLTDLWNISNALFGWVWPPTRFRFKYFFVFPCF